MLKVLIYGCRSCRLSEKKLRLCRAVLQLSVLCLCAVSCLSAGCARPRAVGEERRLVVCTSEREELMDAVIPLFEEKYGIQVSLVQGENVELLEQIRRGETKADVVMGLSLSDISDNRQLFQEYVSVNDKYLLEPYRNTDGYATSFVLNGSCLIVNRTLAGEYSISGYRDLLNPDLKGKIIMADPSSSSTGFAQLVNILETEGGCEEAGAWELAGQIIGQTRGYASESRQVYSSVAKGEYVAGLSYEAAGASLMREGADVAIVYPEEGAFYSPRAAAIVGDAVHPEYAKHFVDFITGKDMQDIFGTLLSSRPVRQDAKISPYLQDLNSIYVIIRDEEYLKTYEKLIREKYMAMAEREGW